MREQKDTPPAFAAWILGRISRHEDRLSILSDFSEIFEELVGEKGHFRARRWYWTQVARSLPLFIFNHFYWSVTMIRNYLKIAFRNFKRQKAFSFINISGLALGMACCLFLMLFIHYELSFDRYHENADRIFRVAQENPEIPVKDGLIAITPAPLGPALVEEYSDVISAARIFKARDLLVSNQDRRFIEETFYFCDPELFQIFSFSLTKGDPAAVLEHPNSLVISEKMALKYFGNEDPIGKVLTLENTDDYIISGVMKNFASNSHFHMDFAAPFSRVWKTFKSWLSDMNVWWHIDYYTYILLDESSDPAVLENRFPMIVEKYSSDLPYSPKNQGVRYFLQPLTHIHLHSQYDQEIESNIDIRYIYLFSAVAVLILIIACLNYMNLSTARSRGRAREIGIRKVVGAQRSELVKQFFGEAFIFSLIGIGIALLLVTLLLPVFNSASGKEIRLDSFAFIYSLCLLLLTTCIAGSYPALMLSSFQPIRVLNNRFAEKSKGPLSFRDVLVLMQYVMSISLIICTLGIQRQLKFIRNTNLGFQSDHVLTISVKNAKWQNKARMFTTELMREAQVLDVTNSQHLPSRITTNNYPEWEGQKESQRFSIFYNCVDENYIPFYKMELAQGRNFKPMSRRGSIAYAIINETALKAFGWEDAVGKVIRMMGIEWTIAGVAKDFHFDTLHQPINPMVFLYAFNWQFISVRIHSEDVQGTIQTIEKKWKTFSPDYPFTFSFLDDQIDRIYRSEMRVGQIFGTLTFIAVLIACLGLFGLSSYTIQKRVREISIRKTFGASVVEIIILLSKGFTKWVLLANIIAWPIAYLAVNKWLQNFAYRSNITIGILVFSGVLALLTALLTISYQTIKAATANPVDSLRYE
jgi:putative ABC transport system permease protein